ncbi:hypothetical protein [Actinokineospora sp. NPDC004072]
MTVTDIDYSDARWFLSDIDVCRVPDAREGVVEALRLAQAETVYVGGGRAWQRDGDRLHPVDVVVELMVGELRDFGFLDDAATISGRTDSGEQVSMVGLVPTARGRALLALLGRGR